MARTLEEILAASGQEQPQPANRPRTVDEIIANLPKQTYPGFGAPDPEKPSGFVETQPGKMVYVGTGKTLNDIQSAGAAGLSFGRFAAENIVPLATMEFGGSLIPNTLVKARPIVGAALKTAARAAGFATGAEATAPLSGEAPSLRRGLRTARNVALFEGAVRTPGYMMGRASGVDPATAALAQDNPKLLKPAPASEFAGAATDIANTKIPVTAEHAAYMGQAAARGKINGLPYVVKIMREMQPLADEGSVVRLNRHTDNLANRLLARLDDNFQISAKDLDEWLRINVSEPAARVYEKGSNVVPGWPERLATLRDKIAPDLYKDIGPEAASLQKTASERLGAAEPKFFSKKTIESPTALRQILKDTDLGEEVRTRLRGLDALAGTHHYERVEELARRSVWTGSQQEEVEAIFANMPAIARERIGMVRAGARKAGRGLTKIARTAGRIAGVAQVGRRNAIDEEQNP